MALVLRTVTGTVKKPSGAEWEGGKIYFSLLSTQPAASGVIVPKLTVEVTADAQGAFSISLFTAADSFLNYDVTLPNGETQTVSLPDGEGDALLSELLDAAAQAEEIAIRPATEDTLGGVMVDGTTITIDEDGVISAVGGGGGGVTDHGALTGLSDDDHPQYLNTARGDARYYTEPEMDVALANKQEVSTPVNEIAALSPTNDDFIVRAGDVWTNQNPTQVKTTLALDNVPNTDATDRANHTGTQPAATISDFNSAALSAAPAETVTTIGALVNGATSKTTPVDADQIGLMDSAASNVWKKLSWANLKATLKSYFDTLYAPIGGGGIGGTVGTTDNAVPRANGTGGATLQSSGVIIDDSDNISTTGTVKATTFQAPNGSDTVLKTAAAGGDLKIQNAFSELGFQYGDNRRVRLAAVTYMETRPGQITSDQNDYAMGNANSTVVYLNSDAARSVTGLASTLGHAATNTAGMYHRLINNGSFNITLKHEDAGSAAANRFTNSTGADIVLAANQGADLHYDGTATRWRVFKLN